MKKIEKLIRDMRKQLLPYHHEHDIESGGQRWKVGDGEYISSWMAEQLRICREKNRCYKRGRCVFYDYGDLSMRNFEICREVLIRLENGEISCEIDEEE